MVNGSPEITGPGATMIVGIPIVVVADKVVLEIMDDVTVGLEVCVATGALVHPNGTEMRKAMNTNKTYFFILLLFVKYNMFSGCQIHYSSHHDYITNHKILIDSGMYYITFDRIFI
jgi:hypothetical protein